MPPKVAYITEGVLLAIASVELTYFFITHLAPGMKTDTQWKKKWELNLGGMVDEVMASGEKKVWGVVPYFFWLTFSTVFREGFEAVIFITPFAPLAPPWALTMAGILGLMVGLTLGITTFMMSKKMDLTCFFIAAAVFFLFMSAGLMSHASYEFQKAGVFGTWACDVERNTTVGSSIDANEADAYRMRMLSEVHATTRFLASENSCDDDGGDDTNFFDYRRQLAEDRFKRSDSCDCVEGESVAWVNIEVWDIADCCDIGFEGSGMFFFVMMILFWYRPRMSRLELIMMCSYWPIALLWGYFKVKSIHLFNNTLDELPVAELVAMDSYNVTFNGPKLGLDLIDADGKVCVKQAYADNADVISAGDYILSLNDKSLAELKIRSHKDLAGWLQKNSARPLNMTLNRKVPLTGGDEEEALTVCAAGEDEEALTGVAIVPQSEPAKASYGFFS